VPLDSIILPTRKGKPLWLPDFDDKATMDILREFIRLHHPWSVVVDSTTYASVYNTGKPNEAKLAYNPIMDVLADTNTAGIAVTHTNAQGGVLMRRGLELFRTKISASSPDPQQPNKIRLECTKSDDIKPPALGATFTDKGVAYDTDPPESPEPAQRGRKATTSPGLAEFLWTFLEGRPAAIRDIIDAARDKGLLKRPTDDNPKPSISGLYDAKGWVERLHPGKKVDEFVATTERGNDLKYWQIVDAPTLVVNVNPDSPF
jgi:hypothetical protein